MEAGSQRKVNAEVDAVAFAAQARLLAAAKPGSVLKLGGFLAAKSRRSKKLVLHATEVTLSEGV